MIEENRWKDYCLQTRRTRGKNLTVRKSKFNCFLGLLGESGEIFDGLKKQIFHPSKKKSLEEFKDYMELEVGDVLWYTAWLYDMGYIPYRAAPDPRLRPRLEETTLPREKEEVDLWAEKMRDLRAGINSVLYSLGPYRDPDLDPDPEENKMTHEELTGLQDRWEDLEKEGRGSIKGRLFPANLITSLANLYPEDQEFLERCMNRNIAKLKVRHPQCFS